MATEGEAGVAAIVLAAGRGTRFAAGSDAIKVLAEVAGEAMVRRVARAALESRARPVVVVVGYEATRVREALSGCPVAVVTNPNHATGLASSLHAGLGALPASARGAIILLGDMPFVSADLLNRLVSVFADNPDCDAVTPVHDGRRGNPVLLSRSLFAAVETLHGDEGARRLLSRSNRVLEIPVEDRAVAIDIDTRDILDVETRRF